MVFSLLKQNCSFEAARFRALPHSLRNLGQHESRPVASITNRAGLWAKQSWPIALLLDCLAAFRHLTFTRSDHPSTETIRQSFSTHARMTERELFFHFHALAVRSCILEDRTARVRLRLPSPNCFKKSIIFVQAKQRQQSAVCSFGAAEL